LILVNTALSGGEAVNFVYRFFCTESKVKRVRHGHNKTLTTGIQYGRENINFLLILPCQNMHGMQSVVKKDAQSMTRARRDIMSVFSYFFALLIHYALG
jgi:hypothetical protein